MPYKALGSVFTFCCLQYLPELGARALQTNAVQLLPFFSHKHELEQVGWQATGQVLDFWPGCPGASIAKIHVPYSIR